nr:hypothetical protein [Enhygromyxa salina]
MDRHEPIDRVNEPVLPDTVALVDRPLDQVVAPGCRWRQDLDDQLGCATAAAVVELGQVTHDRDVGLDDRLDLLIEFVALGEANVEGRRQYATALGIEVGQKLSDEGSRGPGHAGDERVEDRAARRASSKGSGSSRVGPRGSRG